MRRTLRLERCPRCGMLLQPAARNNWVRAYMERKEFFRCPICHERLNIRDCVEKHIQILS